VWEDMRRAIDKHCVEVTLVELFGGLSTGYIALAALGVRVTEVLYSDTNSDLLHWVSRLHARSPCSLRVGKLSGDIMRHDIASLPFANILIAGPPCPPFSCKGVRKCWEDRRSEPFWKTIEIIAAQALSEAFLFFILENVEGFTQAQPDGTVPLLDVIALLLELLPSGWTVDHNLVNTRDFGLPQQRLRVYVVGRRIASTDSMGTGLPPPLRRFARKAALPDIVDWDAPTPRCGYFFGQCGKGYSPLQQHNLATFKAWLKPELTDVAYLGSVACFAYDRTPGSRTAYGVPRLIDLCECLTATGPALHVISLGDSGKALDRALLVSERGRLQGFPSWYIANGFMANEAREAVGNAMSVPVVASVCFREIAYCFGIVVEPVAARVHSRL
jgi:site-specific DNA-cytosine methylase